MDQGVGIGEVNDEGADFEGADFAAWQERVKDANISDLTLLATDYLNHFNEIIMLIGMLPDMPDLLEECRTWQPKGYQDHFRDSGFSDSALAVEAYDHVPVRFRVPFEETIGQMNGLVIQTLEILDDAVGAGDAELLHVRAEAASRALQRLVDVANAIIHGSDRAMAQSEIDTLIGP